MVKSIVTIMLVGLSSVVHAASPGTLSKFEQVVEDSLIKAVVTEVQTRESVQCGKPQQSSVSWRCLNGSQCGYTYTLVCPSAPGENEGAIPRSVVIKTTGFLNGEGQNLISEIQFERAE